MFNGLSHCQNKTICIGIYYYVVLAEVSIGNEAISLIGSEYCE